MSKELTNINVKFISLVANPANGKDIVMKSQGNRVIPIKKYDTKEGIVYGIVYAPNDIDSDGEYASSDTIKQAAYDFMKNKNNANIDVNHSEKVVKAYVCESYIVKGSDSILKDATDGSWVVGIKLEDEELKQQVASGVIGGISMAGTAVKVDGTNQANNSSNDVTKAIIAGFGGIAKLFKKEDNKVDTNAIAKAISDGMKPVVEKMDTMAKEIDELKKSRQETEETLKKSKQNTTPQIQEISKGDSIEGIM